MFVSTLINFRMVFHSYVEIILEVGLAIAEPVLWYIYRTGQKKVAYTTVSVLIGSLANGDSFIALQLVTFFHLYFTNSLSVTIIFYINELGNAYYCLQSDSAWL